MLIASFMCLLSDFAEVVATVTMSLGEINVSRKEYCENYQRILIE